jgi:class 3 adenylate cyclase
LGWCDCLCVVGGGRVELVTVLFSDLAGSTARRVRLGEAAADRLRVEHDRAVIGAIEQHAGRVVKHTGDGVMAIFSGASDAVAAAVALQQAVTRASGADPETALRVRVGLSAGDVTVEGDDRFGLPVVEAQRLEAAAAPGQILCASLVRTLAHGRGAHEFRPAGAIEVKGLDQPLEADEVVWEPLPESSSRVLPPVITAATGFPLVGRADLLAQIDGAWSETAGGATRVVLLAGEPGAGKTRLAAEAARRVADRRGLVLGGRSDEHVRVPYQPFAEALAFEFERQGRYIVLGTLGNELQRLVPVLGSAIPGLGAPLVAEPDAERIKLFDAVHGWLAATAEERPVMLLLDDLHWADLDTVLLLRHVVISVPVERMLVVATYRDTDIDRGHPLSLLLGELRRAGAVTRLLVQGLGADEVEALLATAAGHSLDEAGTALAHEVHAETGGNPFFVSEVLRHLAETGAIEQHAGRWVVADPSAPIVLPEGIRDVVGRRISTLPDTTQRLLSTAAVIGPEFALDLVAAVSGLDDDTTLDALEAALNAQLLREVGVGEYRFAHALVQSTLEGELSDTRRALMHRRTGEALEKLRGDDPASVPELARHWALAAGRERAALVHVRRAAEQALAQAAPAEAARWYRVALDLVDNDLHLEAELLVQAGKAEFLAGLFSGRDTLLEAARRADQVGDLNLMCDALGVSHRRAASEVNSEVDSETMALLERAIAMVPTDDADRRALLLARLALECIFTGEVDRRVSLLSEAEALVNGITDETERFRVTEAILEATPYSRQTTVWRRASLDRYRAARPFIEASDDFSLRFDYLGLGIRLLCGVGEREGLDANLDECVALVADSGHPFGEQKLPALAMGLALIDGRLDDAARHGEDFRARWTARGIPETAAYYDGLQYQLARERGLLKATGARLATGLLTRSPGPRPDVLAALAALTFMEAGLLEDARAVVDERSGNDFGDVPDEAALPIAWAGWAEATAATGHMRATSAMYAILAADPDRHLATGGWYLGSAQRYLALLADALDRPDEADERFALAVAAHERMATPPWLARTLLDWADHKLIHRDNTTSRLLAERALTEIGDLPLSAQRERAERLLQTMA